MFSARRVHGEWSWVLQAPGSVLPPSGDLENHRRSYRGGGEGRPPSSHLQLSLYLCLSVGGSKSAARTCWAEGMVGERDAGPGQGAAV